jgi:hypothetical protein
VAERRECAPAFLAKGSIMRRYYFNVHDGSTILDEEGTEFPSLAAARNAAIVHSGEILKDGAAAALWAGEPWRMWVTDAPNGGGETLFTLRFSGADGEGTSL